MIERNGIAAFALLCLVALSLGGCVTLKEQFVYDPVSLRPPEVFVRPLIQDRERVKLAVLNFFAPSYAAGAADTLTSAYSQALIRSGLFREVAIVRQSTPENLNVFNTPSIHTKDYDLVLRGKIDYLMAGSGAEPTRLTVEIQVVDVSRQLVLWYVKQDVLSTPGSDTDLILYNIPGQPAVSYQELATALANQFAQTITPPQEDTPATPPPMSPPPPLPKLQ